MEDLSQQIQNILSDPQAMRSEIQGLLRSFLNRQWRQQTAAPEPPTAAPALLRAGPFFLLGPWPEASPRGTLPPRRWRALPRTLPW